MFLKEVIFNGFKSFADKTRVVLDKGVTCIVGPNGCGKSNIVDAIRWVLGEQSAKALRGGKMEDVIFAGTDKRKPLQLCEVSLIFSDCEKELGVAFNEVEITRRVTREGSSDYMINGKSCRLKDIQQLFMDTGIGRVSYSFMVQGQIDQILSSNPAERRTIFEEAAGITKYKAQRKETLNKLSLVDQNLSRITDIIEEVNKRIVSLKRQASKALRYKQIKHRLSQLDLASNSYNYKIHSDRIVSLNEEISSLSKILNEGKSGLEEKESSLKSNKDQRSSLYEELQEMQQMVFNLRSEKEQAENQSEFSLIRVNDLSDRIKSLTEQNASLEEQLKELEVKSKQDSESKQLELSLFDSSDEHFKIRARELESIDEKLRSAESELSSIRNNILSTETKITRFRSEHTTLEVDLKTSDIQKSNLRETIYQSEEEHTQNESELSELKRVFEIRSEEKNKLEAKLNDVQLKLKEEQEAFRETQKSIQELDRQIARKNAQLSLLEELETKFEGFSEGAKAIFNGKISNVLSCDKSKLVIENITIESDKITIIEKLLGAAIDAISIEEPSRVIPVTEAIKENKIGSTCLQLPINLRNEKAQKIPACLESILDFININNSEFKQLTENLFSNCYLCHDLESFIEFWNNNPSFQFSFVITENGELIDPRGLLYVGRSITKESKSSFIQRKNEKNNLEETITLEKKDLSKLQEKAKAIQESLDEKEEEEIEIRERLVETSQEINILKSDQANLERKLEKFTQVTERYRNELDTLDTKYTQTKDRLEKIALELSNAEVELESNRQKISLTEENISLIRDERDSFKESLSETKLELHEKKKRLEFIEQSLQLIEMEKENTAEKIEQNSNSIESIKAQVVQLKENSLSQKRIAEESQRTLDEKIETLNEKKELLIQFESQIKEIEDILEENRSQYHSIETRLNGFEVNLAKEVSKKQFITEKVQSEYELDIESVNWKRSLWDAENAFKVKLDFDDIDSIIDDIDIELSIKEPTEKDLEKLEHADWESIKNEVTTLKSRISSIGAVNLVAIEEYKELKERHDFLKGQSDDLWNSKEELVRALNDINETSKQLFQETFDKVKKNFEYTFQKLFGGGTGDLQLIDAEGDNVLDSGIEVIARPPGTKLKSISLLSGGQRTMTAVGLLFAIYMVKPSPFCVLDELDAPLDDANIGRFTEMLREFTKYSQFLVVTHSKRTISVADCIYGVTMQERGVTQLISMRFNKENNSTEEAPLLNEETLNKAEDKVEITEITEPLNPVIS